MDFTGKCVVVTGAGGDIPKAVAKKFYEKGAKLALVSRKKESAEKSAKDLGFSKDRVFCISCDIANEDSVKDCVAKIKEIFGSVDVLCNVAGMQPPSFRTQDHPFSDFKVAFEANVYGTFLMMKHCLPIMIAQGKGSIVNTGSVSGMHGYPFEIAYGATKAAIILMSESVANENGKNGVRCNCVSPGWVDTAMARSIWETYADMGMDDPMDNVTFGPLDRPASPEEIANAFAFLASDEAGYCNGTNLLVDGGMTIG